MWLDPQQPHDPQRAATQMRDLLDVLGPPPASVLDLGCGAGRCLLPLVEAGHQVIGLDSDAAVLERCRNALEARELDATLHRADFNHTWPAKGPFDAVCCLGNTLMLVCDIEQAVSLGRRARAALRAGGRFIIDNLPADFWPELTEGYWQSGLSHDGTLQMVWAEDDAVFTLRGREAIDPGRGVFDPEEQTYRLWTMGDLHLLAATTGLSAPMRSNEESLLIMHAPDGR